MRIIGIDCGLTGALASIRDDGAFEGVWDLPVISLGKSKWIDATELLPILREARDGSDAHAIVERVHAMPAMGTVAANSKGLTLGSTLAVLQVAGIPTELVEPGVWKRGLGLIAPKASDRERKEASLHKARMLFPSAPLERMKDNGRAEALLIAWWHLQRRTLRKAA